MKFIELTEVNTRHRVFINPEQIIKICSGYLIKGEPATAVSLPLEGANSVAYVAETPHQILDLIEGEEEEEV